MFTLSIVRHQAILATVIAAALAIITTSNAYTQSYSVNDLPELPLELLSLGGKLGHSPTEPVLTIRPPQVAAPEHIVPYPAPGTTAHCPSSSSHYLKKYITQVTYPKVTCYPNNAPSDQVLARAFTSNRESSKPAVQGKDPFDQDMRFFKLSSFEGKKLTNPLYCTVHGGPWSASVTETQGCRVACPVAKIGWQLAVNSFPDLELKWTGTWQDIPAHIHPTMGLLMNDLVLVNDTTQCCTGFRRCRQNDPCTPSTVSCSGSHLE